MSAEWTYACNWEKENCSFLAATSQMLLLYTLCHWAHVTTRSSEHTLLFQVWSKIQASESYFISETVIAQLFVQPQEISRAIIQNTIQWQFSVSELEPADILLRIRTQSQNFAGQEPAKPQAREGQLLQLSAKEGISWRITRSIFGQTSPEIGPSRCARNTL